MRFRRSIAVVLALAGPASAPALAAESKPVATIAVAAFDYSDSSGEPGDRSAEHAGRTIRFAAGLERRLADGTGLRRVSLGCATAGPCTAATTPPEILLADARSAQANFLVFGRIHKMSTLVGWGRIDVLDVGTGKLVFDRVISFRGDNDEAFERAADFTAKDILRTIVPSRAATPGSDRGIR